MSDGKHEALQPKKVWFSNETYDALVWIAQIFLPALGVLYATLAGLWNFPNPEAVVGTIIAIDLFLGALLKISKSKYDHSTESVDGRLVVEPSNEEGLDIYRVQVPFAALQEKQKVTLEVIPPTRR